MKLREVVRRIVLGSATALLLSLAAATPARAQWVAAGYLGIVRTADSSMTLTRPDTQETLRIDPVSWDAAPFRSPPYYGYRLAYLFPTRPRIGLEAELIHLKVFAEDGPTAHVTGRRAGIPVDQTIPIHDIAQHFEISHGVNLILFNLILEHGMGSRDASGLPRVFVVARAGLGPSLPHQESTIEGIPSDQYEFGALGMQVAGGAEFRLVHGLYGLLEYKLTRTRQTVTVAGGLGTMEALLDTSHLVFGAAYHF